MLAALDEKRPPVFQGGTSCVHLTRPAYVELQHLVLAEASGNGLNIDDGGSSNGPAQHLVLRGLQVRNIGPGGNHDGIKLSGVDHFVIADCVVQRWGDGGSAIDLVGCHDGQISACTFRHRGDIAGNGVQTKGGSAKITIRNCRFENAGGRAVNLGGSTGAEHFRPQGAGYEARDITVEDCTFIGSMTPIAFVGADRVTVRYNTFYRPTHWVLRILQESRGEQFVLCRNGSFTNNVIAFRADELRTAVNVGEGTAPQTFTFAKNHWYCLDNAPRSARLALPVKEIDGRYGQNPQFVDEQQHDLRLTDSSPVRDAGVRVATSADGAK